MLMKFKHTALQRELKQAQHPVVKIDGPYATHVLPNMSNGVLVTSVLYSDASALKRSGEYLIYF